VAGKFNPNARSTSVTLMGAIRLKRCNDNELPKFTLPTEVAVPVPVELIIPIRIGEASARSKLFV
jgi:hypothetical protein